MSAGIAVEDVTMRLHPSACIEPSVRAALNEQVLDHRAGRQQIQAGEQQLGIRRDALEDRVRKMQPVFRVSPAQAAP